MQARKAFAVRGGVAVTQDAAGAVVVKGRAGQPERARVIGHLCDEVAVAVSGVPGRSGARVIRPEATCPRTAEASAASRALSLRVGGEADMSVLNDRRGRWTLRDNEGKAIATDLAIQEQSDRIESGGLRLQVRWCQSRCWRRHHLRRRALSSER